MHFPSFIDDILLNQAGESEAILSRLLIMRMNLCAILFKIAITSYFNSLKPDVILINQFKSKTPIIN